MLSPSADGIDLPTATIGIDQMFIVPLATSDRLEALAFHEALGFTAGATYTFPYTVINAAFNLPADHPTTLTMTRVGAIAASEIDQYPPGATPRTVPAGELPPGNAMVSFIVGSLDAVSVPVLGPPMRGDGPVYEGRRGRMCPWHGRRNHRADRNRGVTPLLPTAWPDRVVRTSLDNDGLVHS